MARNIEGAGEMNINIKIISGVEGKSLYINDRRVSGSKPSKLEIKALEE